MRLSECLIGVVKMLNDVYGLNVLGTDQNDVLN